MFLDLSLPFQRLFSTLSLQHLSSMPHQAALASFLDSVAAAKKARARAGSAEPAVTKENLQPAMSRRAVAVPLSSLFSIYCRLLPPNSGVAGLSRPRRRTRWTTTTTTTPHRWRLTRQARVRTRTRLGKALSIHCLSLSFHCVRTRTRLVPPLRRGRQGCCIIPTSNFGPRLLLSNSFTVH